LLREFTGWLGEAHDLALYTLSMCDGTQNSGHKIYDIPFVFFIRILSTEVKKRRLVFRNMADGHGWTFLSNHAHVLLCIAGEPGVRLREVAHRVGITERAVQRIVADLEEGGYLSRSREGRRNRYEVHLDRPLRHAVESHREVRVLLHLILRPDQPDPGDPEN
jgi:DNA-binding MarR family transcriptional regulator